MQRFSFLDGGHTHAEQLPDFRLSANLTLRVREGLPVTSPQSWAGKHGPSSNFDKPKSQHSIGRKRVYCSAVLPRVASDSVRKEILMSTSAGTSSSASVYTTPAFWERLWQSAPACLLSPPSRARNQLMNGATAVPWGAPATNGAHPHPTNMPDAGQPMTYLAFRRVFARPKAESLLQEGTRLVERQTRKSRE